MRAPILPQTLLHKHTFYITTSPVGQRRERTVGQDEVGFAVVHLRAEDGAVASVDRLVLDHRDQAVVGEGEEPTEGEVVGAAPVEFLIHGLQDFPNVGTRDVDLCTCTKRKGDR